MITLYHCSDARSFRALWTLEELNLNYALTMLPFPPRFLPPGYMAANPFGTVPLLLDGDVRMTESAAIVDYVGQRYAPGRVSVSVAEADFGRYLNFLHFGEATLTFPQTLILRYARFEPVERRQPQVAEDYRAWFLARLKGLDIALEGRNWLCEDRFTGADISVGYALLLASSLNMQDQFPERVVDYWNNLQGLDSFRRAKAAQAKQADAANIGPTI